MTTFFSGLWTAFLGESKGYTRLQYAFYVLRRLLESALIFAIGAFVVLHLQIHHLFKPSSLRWLVRLCGVHVPPRPALIAMAYTQWYWWPFVAGAITYLILGPKQRRPIYLRIPKIMYRYAGVNVDRNAGSRGGLILGATGSGKTAVCINPRNHSIAINECGEEKTTWKSSRARVQFEALKGTFREQTADTRNRINELVRAREKLTAEIDPVQDLVIDELFAAINQYQITNPTRPFTATVFDAADIDEIPPEVQFRSSGSATPDDALRLLTWVRNANRFGLLENLPMVTSPKLQENLATYAELVERDNALRSELDLKLYLLQVKRNDLQKFADGIKALRYKIPPFGCLGIGAKGNEWQTAVPMLSYYDRDEDVCLLQTRPENAPEGWTPPAQFNLISYDSLPAPTYAQILFATYSTISQKDEMDYFDNAARDQIGFGISLLRAIRDAQAEKDVPVERRVVPNLTTLCEIFTTLKQYNVFLIKHGAGTEKKEVPYFEDERQPDGTMKRVQKTRTITPLPAIQSKAINAARSQIEGGYWALADETLKSVMGSIRNVLVPFTEPEVSQVFCEGNTFDLREMEYGKCVYVAMPPKYSVQRQYVGTILKNLTYTLINERFALERSDPRFKYRNLVLVDSDEHQISAGREDQRVDIIREANGTLYAATQMRNALWKTYGGRDKATPIINNLRNLWVCQAAHEDCAKETSDLIGKIYAKDHSYSSGRGGSTTTNYRERHIISVGQLTSLSAFHVYWMPAEGKFLYRKVITMPVTPDGRVPAWWFGTWNPFYWVTYTLRMPSSLKLGASLRIPLHPGDDFLYPWRAKAPAKAQWRYILGLDGTFIKLRSMRRKHAEHLSAPPGDR